MKDHARFGTALLCMDGRIQEPVIRWFQRYADVDVVDVITEPGMDAVCATASDDAMQPLREKVSISTKAHQSRILAIVGHTDCAGNLVSGEQHRQQIRTALKRIRSWGLGDIVVKGLWVDEQWEVETVDES